MNPVFTGQQMVSVGGLGSGPDGLGYDFTISTPVGNVQFSIPVEKWISDAGKLAASTAKDQLLPVIEGAVPSLIGLAVPELQKHLPELINTAVPEIKKHIPELIDSAIPEINKQLPGVIRAGVVTVKQEITPSTKTILAVAAITGLAVIGTMAYKKHKRKKTA